MSEQPDYNEISLAQWEGVAGGWKAHAAELEERGAGLAAGWMLDAAQLQPGQRVLELACGPAGVMREVRDSWRCNSWVRVRSRSEP